METATLVYVAMAIHNVCRYFVLNILILHSSELKYCACYKEVIIIVSRLRCPQDRYKLQQRTRDSGVTTTCARATFFLIYFLLMLYSTSAEGL